MRITRALGIALVLLIACRAFALDPTNARIGVLQTAERHHGPMERLISGEMPAALAEELRRAGFDARVLTRTIDDVDSQADGFDLLVEVVYHDAAGGYLGGVGLGGGAVGAEVAMAYTQVDARVTLYDAASASREVVRSFDVKARTTGPVLAGVGLGGRDGFVLLRLPFRSRNPYRRVIRAFAKEAVRQIATR